MTENQDILSRMLQAMTVTKSDIADDFAKAISDVNQNGIYSAVWARRCKVLVEQFSGNNNVIILHIKRRGIWQIDPVFDKTTETLYLLFAKDNLKAVQAKYFKNGYSTHYLVSLLLKNDGLYSENEKVQLSLFDEFPSEKERKQKDVQKMLGNQTELVKRVRCLAVDYYRNEAIGAQLYDYTSNFQLVNVEDVSVLLPANVDSINTAVISNSKKVVQQEKQMLVTLKTSIKKGK